MDRWYTYGKRDSDVRVVGEAVMPNLGNLVLALVVALLTNWFSSGSIWPREEGVSQWASELAGVLGSVRALKSESISKADREEEPVERASGLAVEKHSFVSIRPPQQGIPSGLDPYELAQEAEDAVGSNNREAACRVKNAFRNLNVPGTHWVKRSVIRRFEAIRARLDALCPVLDPIQLPVSLGLRGAL